MPCSVAVMCCGLPCIGSFIFMHDLCLTAQYVLRCWLVAAKRGLAHLTSNPLLSPPHRITACVACRWVAAAAAAAAAAWAAPCLAPSLMQVGWRSLAG